MLIEMGMHENILDSTLLYHYVQIPLYDGLHVVHRKIRPTN
jgi:hypothetical protein